jgi:tetratricopeptide (TPR) repeat protein
MIYQDYIQRVQQATQLIHDAHFKEAVEALYQLFLSDISDLDKADICSNLAEVYDRMGNTDLAMTWYEKGISLEQDYCRYAIVEKKAQCLSQLGRNDQAVSIYESLIQQPFVTEAEKERMRKVIQTLLGKALRGWQ